MTRIPACESIFTPHEIESWHGDGLTINQPLIVHEHGEVFIDFDTDGTIGGQIDWWTEFYYGKYWCIVLQQMITEEAKVVDPSQEWTHITDYPMFIEYTYDEPPVKMTWDLILASVGRR